jgi:hypothetical protein
VKNQAYDSRTFKILADDGTPWDTGEILSPAGTTKEEVWNQLSTIRPLPHFSQFIITYDHGEVPVTSRLLPLGNIVAIRAKFPVTWRIELLSEEVIQPDMTPALDVDEAWTLLHNQVPRLYPRATFNYRGKLQPKAIITASVFREDVTFTIAFEVKDHGWITFPGNTMSNMTTRQEIYDLFSHVDPRLPPFEEYIDEENRPYQNGDLLCFNLKGFIEITDRSNEGPGRTGGDNGHKLILPPIIYGKPPINTSDPKYPKITGGSKGTVDGSDDSDPDSCSTDSEEDIDGDYTHRHIRIQQALHRKEPVTAVFVGRFQGFQCQLSQCLFRIEYLEESSQNMAEFFEINRGKLHQISTSFAGEDFPGAFEWVRCEFTDPKLDIQVNHAGKGLQVWIQHQDLPSITIPEHHEVYSVDFPYGFSIAFAAAPNLTDNQLMELFQKITAVPCGPQLAKPWQFFLEQKLWRKGDTNEVAITPTMDFSGVNPDAVNPRVPMNASNFFDETEITSPSDISRTMKFARDSGWDYFISVASTFDGTNELTVSYKASLEDCVDERNWYWTQFLKLLKADGMDGFPCAARTDLDFDRKCFVGDRTLHTMLFEKRASTKERVKTTEDDGPPCFLAFAPKAVMKLRAESTEMVQRIYTICYNRAPTNVRELRGKYWGLSFSVDGGTPPDNFELKLQKKLNLETSIAYNREILANGFSSANYRAGTGKFAAAFKPEKPYSATIAIESGIYGEYGVAIMFEQKTRRCLLTRRLFGAEPEDIFWETMKIWAEFEPRHAFPRKDAGQLYYPAVFSHMFEQHWDFIHAPLQENAPCESAGHYASAAAQLTFSCNALVDAEAPDRSSSIAQSGAMSRKYPVQDAQDFWSSLQEQAQEECVTVEYGFAPEPDSHNVGTSSGEPV